MPLGYRSAPKGSGRAAPPGGAPPGRAQGQQPPDLRPHPLASGRRIDDPRRRRVHVDLEAVLCSASARGRQRRGGSGATSSVAVVGDPLGPNLARYHLMLLADQSPASGPLDESLTAGSLLSLCWVAAHVRGDRLGRGSVAHQKGTRRNVSSWCARSLISRAGRVQKKTAKTKPGGRLFAEQTRRGISTLVTAASRAPDDDAPPPASLNSDGTAGPTAGTEQQTREGDMSSGPDEGADTQGSGSRRLMVLLAAAMFVLVVDTSSMNVSISAVIEDLDTTASGVQSAIALEALVSAAFILINSKVGDLIGRRRAYVLGLLAYAVGALAMTLSQSLTAIILFWAIIGGLGASLLLPAMQSLIHGNFAGAAQKQAYALVGAAAAIAAAIGPLLGGFVTTYLSWRVGSAGDRRHRDRPPPDRPGPRRAVHRLPPGRRGRRDPVGRRHGRGRPRHPRLAGGRGAVGLLMVVGAVALVVLARWLIRRKRAGKVTLLDPDLFGHPNFTAGVSGQMLQQITLGGAMIALPLLFRWPSSTTRWKPACRSVPCRSPCSRPPWSPEEGRRPATRRDHPHRIPADQHRDRDHHPVRPPCRERLVPRGPARRHGLRAGPAGVAANNYTLAPIEEERIARPPG